MGVAEAPPLCGMTLNRQFQTAATSMLAVVMNMQKLDMV